MNIGIGIACYIETSLEVQELRRCLESVEDFYPIIIIDGKWRDYNADSETSIDEAVDLINSKQNIIHIKSINGSEAENRSKYLEYELDYLIILDTDEYLEFPLGVEFFERGLEEIFRDKEEKCAYIHTESEMNGGYCRFPRIIKNPNLMKYGNRHNQLLLNNTNVLKNPLNAPRGVILHHDKTFRTDNRINKMKIRNKENPLH